MKQTQAQGIIVSLETLNVHGMKYPICTNSSKYATIRAFMYPRCDCARLSGYTPPPGHTMGATPWGRGRKPYEDKQVPKN